MNGFLKQIPEEKLEDRGWLIAVQSYDIARKQTILINKYHRKKKADSYRKGYIAWEVAILSRGILFRGGSSRRTRRTSAFCGGLCGFFWALLWGSRGSFVRLRCILLGGYRCGSRSPSVLR